MSESKLSNFTEPFGKSWLQDETTRLDWLKDCFNRQSKLSIQRPEDTGDARAAGFLSAVEDFSLLMSLS